MTAFRKDFRNAVDAFGGNLSSKQTDAYASEVEAAIEDLIGRMDKLATNQKDIHYAKGDVAEAFHEGTFNLDAVRRGTSARAWTPRDASPIDVRVIGSTTEQAQLKYYREPDATAKAISDPKYVGLEQKVVPADQLEGVRASAARLAEGNARSRPEASASYDHTLRTADDRIRLDGTESRPLTEPESRELTNQLRRDHDVDREQFRLTTDQVIRWQDVLRESTSAAARAAIISVALQSAPYLISVAQKAWETGEISGSDFIPLGQAIPSTILRSGLAAGISAAIVGSARAGLLAGMQQVDPTLVSASVVLAISALETSVNAARGGITWPEAAQAIAEDAIVLAAAMGGAVLGQALIPLPMLGALVGNIVGAAAGRLAVEQGTQVVLGLAVETGWSVFGVVDQDYTVPLELLAASGWNTLEIQPLQLQTLALEPLELEALDWHRVHMTVLRRGVVSFGRVGYRSL